MVMGNLDEIQYKFEYTPLLNAGEKKFNEVCGLSKLFLIQPVDGGNEKQPLILTETQKYMWFNIMTRGKYGKKQSIFITPSQYGKSLIVACATLLRCLTKQNEDWLIIAPSTSKAQVIMTYIREHLADREEFLVKLEKKTDSVAERLKGEKSKTKITFTNGSSIEILSADADSKSEGGMKLMGHHARNIIIDESCELDDVIYMKIIRMLTAQSDYFLVELGNPWKRNHFYESWLDEDYDRIHVDIYDGLKEGRYTEETIELAKKKTPMETQFEVLYLGHFPDTEAQDNLGYAPVFNEAIFKLNVRDEKDVQYFDTRNRTIGLDVAYKGKDTNVWVLRCNNAMKIIKKANEVNPNQIVAITRALCDEYSVDYENVYMDATGGGYLVYNTFLEAGMNINGIEFSTKPNDETYKNIKAEGFFLLNEWLSKGGIIVNHPDVYQLRHIKYKNDNGKIKIISKEELRKQGIHSPDTADAMMLSCVGGIEFEKPQDYTNKILKNIYNRFDNKTKNNKYKYF